ncbi:helix-turn-helix domain-containing protein, partial [Bacteroides fragilis]
VCTILDISERKLLSLRQKGMIPYSRIERKVYYKKDDIMDYMKRNIKTFINNNGNGTGCIE